MSSPHLNSTKKPSLRGEPSTQFGDLSMLSLGEFVQTETVALLNNADDSDDERLERQRTRDGDSETEGRRKVSINDGTGGDGGSSSASPTSPYSPGGSGLGRGDSRRVNFARTARASFSLNSMRRDQSKRRKMTIHRGETEMSAFKQRQVKEETMYRVVIDGDDGGVAIGQVFERIDAALSLRDKYKGTTTDQERATALVERLPKDVAITVDKDGIYQVTGHNTWQFQKVQSWATFAADVEQLVLTVENTMCRKAAAHRLDIIEERSKMFFLLNTDLEERQSYRKGGGVFADVTKVDNSVRMSRAFNAHELLEFFVSCYNRYPNEVVSRDPATGAAQTLRELFEAHGIDDVTALTTQGLGYHPPPPGKGRVDISEDVIHHPLTAALHNACIRIDGRFAPMLYRAHLSRLEAKGSCGVATEHRISVYGSCDHEIVDVARTLKKNELGPYSRNMWFLHVRFCEFPKSFTPRPKTLQEQFDNIFLPLMKATLFPDDPNNAAVLWLLPQLGGLHIETDVTRASPIFSSALPRPSEMPFDGPMPHDLYYLYYTWANLNVLNSLRLRRGQSTLQLRLNGSEVGSMIGGYLLGDVVARCAAMAEHPVLQYLYGMCRIPMCVSPITDNARGIPYERHPLHRFLHRCLTVSLCTESPLHTHHSSYPLIEEYGTAQKLMRLSALDVTELMRNSVMMSSFPHAIKCEWLGEQYHRGAAGNVTEYSHVSKARIDFRDDTWNLETEMLKELHRRAKTASTPSKWKASSTGLSRWHYLSSVKDVEYFNVLDRRIRYPRTVICGPHKEDEVMKAAAPKIVTAMQMRHRYQWQQPPPWEQTAQAAAGSGVESDFQRRTARFNEDDWSFDSMDAVYFPFPRHATHQWHKHIPTLEQFHKDLIELKAICDSVDVKEFSFRRLDMLDHKFRLHLALNHANEAGMTENQETSNRDIYQATKVDTHVHMAAGMTAKQMLNFVLDKVRNNRDDIAMKSRDGSILTLGSMMDGCNIGQSLTIDQLSVQADHTLFERFDNFNNRYNPMENPDLRTLLLKTDNLMNGRYFAEMIHLAFNQMEKDRYTFAENRLSIYGINLNEWDRLAEWFDTHGMSCRHNKWMVQVPRVYKVFRQFNTIGSFGQYLQNIFKPLWEASLHPSEHPSVHNFLKHVSGFDSVDNESTLDLPMSTLSPWEWTHCENPPYNYYMYHLYANVRTLNEFRAARGFTTFDFRPHCGESGSDEHMLGCFLCANAIGHGINLKNDPSLQYLYYLTQIGLHVSPLSNNALFLYFLNNPFPDFFRRGLNVSLSTDDPLMFHQTQEPLIEEYSIAARVWGLSPNDLCEIARNSVLQSGFSAQFKRERIGDKFYMSSSLGNDPLRTHLSDIRVAFRFETYHTELGYLEAVVRTQGAIPRWKITPEEEQEINERQRVEAPEVVLLSTHDQAMEVALRDIESKRDQLRVLRVQVEAQRRRHKGLVENITEIGIRRQQQQQALDEAAAKREAVVYEREHTVASLRRRRTAGESGVSLQLIGGRATSYTAGGGPQGYGSSPQDPGGAQVQRILNWQPSPPTEHRHTREVHFSRGTERPLPNPHAAVVTPPRPPTGGRR